MDMLPVDHDFNALISGRIPDIPSIWRLCGKYRERDDLDRLIRSAISTKRYCHPDHPQIRNILAHMPADCGNRMQKAKWLFEWCLNRVKYGRLRRPFFPLVRTDLDVLELMEGTCGDFSHLVVSLMTALGIPGRYAIVERDMYDDEQDHICAAVYDEEQLRWIMVDLTPSYGRISGWDIRHRKVTLRKPEDHWSAVREEEIEWISRSVRQYGSLLLSGIVFAPWLHEEIVSLSDSGVETVFVLLTLDSGLKWHMSATHHVNGKHARSCPIRIRSRSLNEFEWDACVNEQLGIWDESRWMPRGKVTDSAMRENGTLRRTMEHLNSRRRELQSIIDLIDEEKRRLIQAETCISRLLAAHQSFMPPSCSPWTKYFCRNG